MSSVASRSYQPHQGRYASFIACVIVLLGHSIRVDRHAVNGAGEQYLPSAECSEAWAACFGVRNVRAIVNLALSQGWLGKPYCGGVPIRGHSGVQGGAASSSTDRRQESPTFRRGEDCRLAPSDPLTASSPPARMVACA